jgi:predicted XRE-type DNA-binding protein
VKSQVFKSVWDAIADTPEDAENLKARAALMHHIRARIEKEGLTQTKAAALFGVTQPRMSDLMRGKIDLFSLDTLVTMLARAGQTVELKVSRVRRSQLPA